MNEVEESVPNLAKTKDLGYFFGGGATLGLVLDILSIVSWKQSLQRATQTSSPQDCAALAGP